VEERNLRLVNGGAAAGVAVGEADAGKQQLLCRCAEEVFLSLDKL
jgi:hypothetical protein